jgi:hypothetical protein
MKIGGECLDQVIALRDTENLTDQHRSLRRLRRRDKPQGLSRFTLVPPVYCVVVGGLAGSGGALLPDSLP